VNGGGKGEKEGEGKGEGEGEEKNEGEKGNELRMRRKNQIDTFFKKVSNSRKFLN